MATQGLQNRENMQEKDWKGKKKAGIEEEREVGEF